MSAPCPKCREESGVDLGWDTANETFHCKNCGVELHVNVDNVIDSEGNEDCYFLLEAYS